MARFDVYRNSGPFASTTPYLLDIQSQLLDGLDTRVVIPLRRLDKFPAVNLAKDLTPIFDIEGVPDVLYQKENDNPVLFILNGTILI